ncbi:uncharacterized protein [Mytilus edulis]|uniref:uncharacterized protein n=1 Tax=Mytilus edulis TaxID=6550 RepID=UPI0039EFD0F1
MEAYFDIKARHREVQIIQHSTHLRIEITDMAVLRILGILFCFVAVVNCQICASEAKTEDPFQGKLEDEKGYPKAEIESAYEKLDRDTKSLIDKDAAEMATLSKLDFLPPVSQFSSSLCPHTFVTVYPRGWHFLSSTLGKCWILNRWWNTPLSYAVCSTKSCVGLPCLAKNYRCTPSNYKGYVAWTYCPGKGFGRRWFKLPQCCECQRFKC